MSKRVLALIPARGGSKGLPGKNKKRLAGKPLISYSIEAALASANVTMCAVSSDDEEILAIATDAGAVALRRPVEIAADESPVIDAIRHSLTALAARGAAAFDCIALLQPTSPLRTAADIDSALALYETHAGNPVCSVVRCDDNHPARMYRIVADKLDPLIPEWAAIRRQDLPPVYHRNGAIYVFGPREVAAGAVIVPGMTPYVMPAAQSVNVDSALDFALLEALFRTS